MITGSSNGLRWLFLGITLLQLSHLRWRGIIRLKWVDQKQHARFISRHLRSNIFNQTDLLKILEAEYPTVAQMARDVLAISATKININSSSMLAAIPAIVAPAWWEESNTLNTFFDRGSFRWYWPTSAWFGLSVARIGGFTRDRTRIRARDDESWCRSTDCHHWQ
jgi:hypothetical protein